MLRSRRFALIATIAVLGLSACGDGGSTITSAKAPTVIHLGAASGRNAAPSAEGAVDTKMMAIQNITYVFDGSYPDLGATGKSWTLPAGTSVDKATVAKIAALLGVEGDVRQLPTDQGGGWMVGAADYSTASLTVANDGLLSWWYNPTPSAAVSGGCATAEGTLGGSSGSSGTSAGSETLNPASGTDAVASSTDVAVGPPDSVVVDPVPVPCDVPAAPANVPDKAGATVKAKQFLTSLGLDPSNYEFTAYADDYSANVTAWLLLDGHRSPVQFNFGYGGEGALVWASGSLAVPQPSDEYPLVTPEEGLARLNDQTGVWMAGYGGGGPMRAMASDVAVGRIGFGGGSTNAAPPPSEVITSTEGSVSVAPVPVCDPAADCVIEPGIVPPGSVDPITVHLTGVRLDITTVWADDGTVWLLPAYTFTSSDGGEYSVIAVDDQYIAQPTPAPVDTTPVDSVLGNGSTPIATLPVATLPVDTVQIVVDTTLVTDLSSAEHELVGLSVDEATKVAADHGWTVRVVVLDGESQIVTDDYSPDRINVGVADGLVTSIESRG